MPIGKYIYCTIIESASIRGDARHKCLSASTFTVQTSCIVCARREICHKCLSASTFTVHNKHIMYGCPLIVTNAYRQVHLLYPVHRRGLWAGLSRSQMPIGKYIYCTGGDALLRGVGFIGHKCLSASTFTVRRHSE